jgi:hypothetical protein
MVTSRPRRGRDRGNAHASIGEFYRFCFSAQLELQREVAGAGEEGRIYGTANILRCSSIWRPSCQHRRRSHSQRQDLYTDGDYSKEEYHEKRDAIQDQIMVVQQELSKLEDVNTGMTRIEFLRHLLMSMTPGVDHTYFGYAGTARGEDKRHLVVTAYPDHPSFFTSSGERSMVERQEFYRKMNLAVRVHDDDLELEIATPAISQSADPS